MARRHRWSTDIQIRSVSLWKSGMQATLRPLPSPWEDATRAHETHNLLPLASLHAQESVVPLFEIGAGQSPI